MTNREKFKEIFGFMIDDKCEEGVCPEGFDCEDLTCDNCPFGSDWWNKEYKSCFKLKEGFND